MERFLARIKPGPNGCILWIGTIETNGYGRFMINKRRVTVHRWFYEQKKGPVPAGLVLDHLCRTRNCVNLDHLEPVTDAENMLRGVGAPAQNARKTHCLRGHEFEPERHQGQRRCLICRRMTERARWPKVKLRKRPPKTAA